MGNARVNPPHSGTARGMQSTPAHGGGEAVAASNFDVAVVAERNVTPGNRGVGMGARARASDAPRLGLPHSAMTLTRAYQRVSDFVEDRVPNLILRP